MLLLVTPTLPVSTCFLLHLVFLNSHLLSSNSRSGLLLLTVTREVKVVCVDNRIRIVDSKWPDLKDIVVS